jgi:hypothetical protein
MQDDYEEVKSTAAATATGAKVLQQQGARAVRTNYLTGA